MEDGLKQKIQAYKPNQATIDLIRDTKILLLTGPSGAGKDYLKSHLMPTGEYYHLVSHTTRKPRLNHGVLEQNGVEYHFINQDQAGAMVDAQEFVEVKMYSTNVYGTSAAEVQTAHDAGKVAITDVEVQGIAEYKQLDSNVRAVFLLPPNFKVWHDRLKQRYGDTVDVDDHRRRLQTALAEIKELFTHDYFAVLITDDINHSVQEVHDYIITGKQDEEYVKMAKAVAFQLSEDIRVHLETEFSTLDV